VGRNNANSGVESPYYTCTRLKAMLAQGWEIEAPVYVRPRWASTKEVAYHFILWRGDKVNLVSVPNSPEVQQLVAESNLTVAADP
jgi:hypothetical protein